ncbi:MAG: prepilin-type N-terminal cleavage/methylation domain-containing protein [Oligoflexia bacterium]|nr:prepilin-type N-terminal cleavage/methylation domain-containing protein [Oligoflexia bacterium]
MIITSYLSYIEDRGFTLIELTQVMVLIGILSVVIIPQIIDFKDDAKSVITRSRMIEIKNAIKGDTSLKGNGTHLNYGFELNTGNLPLTLDELVNQGAYPIYNPFTKKGWRGPYLSTTDPNWKKDAWGILFQYDSIAKTISSCGPDTTCGNADDITINL